MFTVTCDRCGASMQLDEARVPPSGMVKKCPSCGKALTISAPPPALNLDGFAPVGGPPAAPPVTPPAPGRPGSALAAFDAEEEGGHPDIVDLPAPKSAVPSASSTKMGMGPGLDADVPDLLAPVGPSSSKSPAATRMGMGAPPPIPAEAPDLLAPVGPVGTRGGRGVTDLPAPVGPTPTRGGPGVTDLLAPVGPQPTRGVTDLPAPVGPVPTRGAGAPDLLQPVGPTPTRGPGAPDLLQPVGPVPTKGAAAPDLLTPVGPVPTKGIDLPAPKGFFDEAPRSQGGIPALELDAPRTGGNLPALDLGDPGPRRSGNTGAPPVADGRDGQSGTLDLDGLDLMPATGTGLPAAPIIPPGAVPPQPRGGHMGPPPATAPPHMGPPKLTSAIQAIDMPEDPGAASLELSAPTPTSGGLSLDNLDLAPAGDGGKSGPPRSAILDDGGDSAGPSAPAGVISFGKPSAAAAAAAADILVPAPPRGGAGAGTGRDLDIATPKAKQKNKGTIAEDPVEAAAGKKADADGQAKKGLAGLSKRARMLVAAAAGVILLGGGAGFYVKMRMDAAAKLAANIKSGLTDVRKLMVSDAADHWGKAQQAAEKVLKLDGKNADALALSAQASLAAAIDTGQKVAERRKDGDAVLQKIAELSLDGVEVDKARALGMILDDKAPEAQKTLQGAQGKARGDGDLGLFLGWAALAAGDAKAAKGGFDAALKANKDRVPALYGKGRAQLLLGDLEGAKKSFDQVLAKRTNHVGAWVGLASMLPEDRVGTREKRFMEIVSSEHAATANPKDVSRAWTYAGDEALAARRWDDAAFRYKKAEDLDRNNLDAIAGRGAALLGLGNALEARKLFDDAHRRDPSHVRALLGLARMALAEGRLDEARTHTAKALEVRPEDATVQLWYAKVMEVSPGPTAVDSAIAAYKKAAQLDPGDFEPVVALSLLYVRMGRSDDALATLAGIAKDAEGDAFLANTLGLAYLSAGRLDDAEAWFRKALALDAQSVDGHANLGLALERKGNLPAAILEYETAAKLDPMREDVIIRLAGAYERGKRLPDAERLYVGLVDESAGKKASIAGRAAAGRWFARRNDAARAGQLGNTILAEDAKHPAGLFLRGVSNLAAGNIPEAQKDLTEAVAIDPQAQYFEALGRTYEKQNAYDDAIAQYTNAIERDKAYAEPLVDRARVHQIRREWGTALKDLELAAKIDPERADVPLMIGESLAKSNRIREAVPQFELAVKRDDQNALAHFSLGQAYRDVERGRDAARHLRRATELAPAGTEWLPDALLALADTLRTLQGLTGETCVVLRRWKNVAPANAAAHREVNTALLGCR